MRRSLKVLLILMMIATQLPLSAPAATYDKAQSKDKLAEAGEYTKFEMLLKAYFDAYASQSPAMQNKFDVAFANALFANQNFTAAKSTAENAANASDGPQDIKSELDDAEKQVNGPLVIAMSNLIANLYSGTISDFNHKILVLGGTYIFDGESAPAIYQLFKAMDSDSYIIQLKRDSDWREQARTGAVAISGVVVVATLVNPKFWVTLARNFGDFRAAIREAIAADSAVTGQAVRVAEETGPAKASAAKSVKVEDITDPEIRAALDDLNTMKTKLNNVEASYKDLGLSAAIERKGVSTTAVAPIAVSRSFRSSIAATGRVSRQKIYARFSGMGVRAQLIYMARAVGILSLGGAVNVARHAGLNHLYTHVDGMLDGIHIGFIDMATRLLPYDNGNEPDLLSRAYNAMAALKYACMVDDYVNRTASFANNIENTKLVTATSQMASYKDDEIDYIAEMGMLITQNNFLNETTIYKSKQFAPEGIHNDPRAHEIVMDLNVGKDVIHEHFACAKFAATPSSARLQISLMDDLYRLGVTYNKLLELNAILPADNN